MPCRYQDASSSFRTALILLNMSARSPRCNASLLVSPSLSSHKGTCVWYYYCEVLKHTTTVRLCMCVCVYVCVLGKIHT
jgi:hypothetical protein